jgi:hypothetical protein
MTNQARIDELKIFFQDTLNNLAAIDSQRIQASMSLFQSKTPDDVANSCIDLQDLDETSQERLEQLKTILLDFQILIQKEDVSDSDYKNVQKETVGLLGLLIKTINKILKARKQEKSALENLVKYLNRLESKKPFVAFMYKRNFNKIKNSIHDEIKAFREFYLLNKRSNDLKRSYKKLKKEGRWKVVSNVVKRGVAIPLFFLPAGMACIIASNKFIDYVNTLTPGYKELESILNSAPPLLQN